MIMDYYLTVRQWKANFDPESATMKRVSVWVRFPGLSIEDYDEDFLLNLGSKIGKVVRVDATTASASRGLYARMCGSHTTLVIEVSSETEDT